MREKGDYQYVRSILTMSFTSDPVDNQQTDQQIPIRRYSFADSAADLAGSSAARPLRHRKQKKKGGKAAKVVALLLACALVGGGSGFGAAALMQKNVRAQPPDSVSSASSDASVMLEGQRQTAALQVASIDTSKVLTPSEVYAQNVNSTVGITTSITTNYFGYQTTGAAAGSGFILTAGRLHPDELPRRRSPRIPSRSRPMTARATTRSSSATTRATTLPS